MPRPWLHPMQHLVRIVHTNGSSVIVPISWQQPGPGLRITTKFLEVDYLTHEKFTGKPTKAKKIGRRAQFENKFAAKPQTQPTPPTTTPSS
eukprot:IDg12100t1